MKHLVGLFIVTLLFQLSASCDKTEKEKTENVAATLFKELPASKTNIYFNNDLKQTFEFNFLNYDYIYTGAGVATGDIDNDGLLDIYFVKSMGENKLYRNKGDLEFENITIPSGTSDKTGFSTGVTMWDANADGYLDIYVCKAGSINNEEGRRNILYINQRDGTFKNEAKKYGLDHPGYATQAYPIDYDNDGDLDLYLVNHRPDFKNTTRVSTKLQREISDTSSDHLFRNDGSTFTKITGQAGLYNKTWGLSAIIADFNEDNWQDIYVSNDFAEPDALYINQKDGTFKNEILQRIKHISNNSMGTDYADLNNDLNPDLMAMDMLSENYSRSKENMAAMDSNTFNTLVKIGYHHAYMANMLHSNVGGGNFQEIGQLSGVTKTDWSWATLLADFNNDGLKDIFVTNGVERDYTNQDAKNKLKENPNQQMSLEALLNSFPSHKLQNPIFKNKGNFAFQRMNDAWGITKKTFSHGAAYADLDNDGDLDLVVNNAHDIADIYQNTTTNDYLQVQLKGPAQNTFALGSQVYLVTDKETQSQGLFTNRGYESSVTHVLHFGLKDQRPQQLVVRWPDGKTTKIENPKKNQRLQISYARATNAPFTQKNNTLKKKEVPNTPLGLDFVHTENPYDDYADQLLLPQKQSTKGTRIAKADVNNDGLEDFFVGNAANAQAALFVQTAEGKFKPSNTALWKTEAKYEDANALFFDADGDSDADLYVVSAGYELAENSPLLQDRLYVNDGKGNFTKKEKALPSMHTSGKSIAAADIDADGDLDLFVGGNVVPKKYPLAPRSHLLQNEKGTFVDITPQNEALAAIGMVSAATFTDYDSDGDKDLLAVGEWMKPTFFKNTNGKFTKPETVSGLGNTQGWWYSLAVADIDGDGDDDYLLGNLGRNNKFQPSAKKPLTIYAKDFDGNGSFDVALSKVLDGKQVPIRGKECSSEQNPFLLDKIKTFKEFARLDIQDIYGAEKLNGAKIYTA
ncbi:MAG: VCBS repeat-containing protein, partial [Marinirhabdus sp.]